VPKNKNKESHAMKNAYDQTVYPYDMTLRELLKSCDFEKIAEHVRADDHMCDCVEGFRKAYNLLLATPPSDGPHYAIEVYWYECRDYEGGGRLLEAAMIEGARWEEVIDSHIYFHSEDMFEEPKELLAYRLMWHLTFFGFTPEEEKETFYKMRNDDYPRNRYGEMAREINLKRYMLLATPEIRRRLIESIKFHEEYEELSFSLPEEDWNAIEYHRRHLNGPKRKREFRLKTREEALVKQALATPQGPIDSYKYHYDLRRYEAATHYKDHAGGKKSIMTP